ncbi:MAG: YwmB family TATA-box binding protein, partial [Moorella sp. (in: Bacteria)]|nr:YwmB family TATA-box binding protein [Moorella sp. (in: firmicutes)]
LFFSLQSLAGDGGGGETYLLVNLESRLPGGAREVQAWEKRIRAAFRPWQVDPHLSYSLVGFIPGRLAAGERQQRARVVLDALEARQVEGVEDEEMYSVSAYSSLLPHHLEVAGRRINTNVALRYHATDDRTYLHLGFPLLGGEY